MLGICFAYMNVSLLPADNGDEDGDEPFPIWKGMSAFEAGESEAPPAGVIVVDPFCDYLGKRCIRILEEAGYAVVQASAQSTPTLELTRVPQEGIVISCVVSQVRWIVRNEDLTTYRHDVRTKFRQHQRTLPYSSTL